MPPIDYRARRPVSFGEALGIVTHIETGERSLTLNRMTTATCACGMAPRLHTTTTPSGLTVKLWIPREHACKGVRS